MVKKTENDTPTDANMESFVQKVIKVAAEYIERFKICQVVKWQAFASLPPSAALNRRGAKTYAVFPPLLKVGERAITGGQNVDVAITDDGAYSIFVSPLEYSTQADRINATPRGTVAILHDACIALMLAASEGSFGSAFQSSASRLGFEPGQPRKDGGKADWRNPVAKAGLTDELVKLAEGLGDPPKMVNALPFITLPTFTNVGYRCPEKGCDSPTLWIAPAKVEKVASVCVEHEATYIKDESLAQKRKAQWIAQTQPLLPGVDLQARVYTEDEVTAMQEAQAAATERKQAARRKAS